MKKMLFVLLGLLSVNSYALTVTLNATDCKPGAEHGGCFQNKSGADIRHKNLYLNETRTSTSGQTQSFYSSLHEFTSNRYVMIDWSTAEMKLYNIKNIKYTILDNGKELPGCVINVTHHSPLNLTINIVKSGTELHC